MRNLTVVKLSVVSFSAAPIGGPLKELVIGYGSAIKQRLGAAELRSAALLASLEWLVPGNLSGFRIYAQFEGCLKFQRRRKLSE